MDQRGFSKKCKKLLVMNFKPTKMTQFVKNQETIIRLRVVPLSLSPSCMTRKKIGRKKWLREILGAIFFHEFFSHDTALIKIFRPRSSSWLTSRTQDFTRPFFSSRFSFAPRTTDKAKRGTTRSPEDHRLLLHKPLPKDGRLDFQPLCEPAFLAPHHVSWEEDK